jgi:calpain-7
MSFTLDKDCISNDYLSDDIEPLAFWRRIYNAYAYGDVIMTIGTGRLTKREEQGSGLASEHDYAILHLKEEKGRRLFLIKNPWSDRSSWKESEHTDKASDAAQGNPASIGQTEDSSPGTFWMELDKVIESFETIYLNWNPGLFSHRQDVHFSWNLTMDRGSSGSFHRNPQYLVSSSGDGSLWLLLCRYFHGSAADDKNGGQELPTGFLSLYAFDNGGRRAILSDGSLRRTPYVDAPNILLRYDISPKTVYTIVVSEQDLPSSSYNFSLSAFSLHDTQINPVEDTNIHSITQEGAWNFSTAGGNSSSPMYHTNPQFNLLLSTQSDVAILLESDDEDIAIHIKVLWSNGKRAVSVTTRDIVCDSGDYRKGSALAEARNLQAGTYTLICSTFEPGKRSKFLLTVRSVSTCTVKPIPLEEAGRLQFRTPPAIFSNGLNRLLAPFQVSRITRLRVRAQNRGFRDGVPSPLRVSIEYGQGPHKETVYVSGDGEFIDASAGVRTDDIDVSPRMCSDRGVWLVVERTGGSCVELPEDVQIDISSDYAVGIGPWGKEMDEPVEHRSGWKESLQ